MLNCDQFSEFYLDLRTFDALLSKKDCQASYNFDASIFIPMSALPKSFEIQSLGHAAKNTRMQLNAVRVLELTNEILDEMRESDFRAEPIFDGNFCLRSEVRKFEENLIRSALRIARGNQKHAAELLGVKYTTLHSKLGILGLDRQEVVRNGR